MTTKQSKEDHGKFVIEYPPQPQPSSTLQALLRSAKINKSLEIMSSEVEAQETSSVPQQKRKNIE